MRSFILIAAQNNSATTSDSELMQAPVLILGLGNILIEDEGVGIAAIEHLQRHYQFPDEVELVDGGTSGMALLDDIRHREKLIVLDAVRTGAPAGTLVVLKDDDVPAFFRSKISPHQTALADVLAALTLTGDKTSDITVIGIVPDSLRTRIGLSDLVTSQFRSLINRVIDELNIDGYSLEPASTKTPAGYETDVLYSLSGVGGILL